jgi:beta-lysine 5,6-aminomutase alpha subunit
LESKLQVDESLVGRCRTAASTIADGVDQWTRGHTTVTVERTVARLLGVDGVSPDDVPLPNILVEQLVRAAKTGDGLFYWMGNACLATGLSPQEVALTAGKDELDITSFEPRDPALGAKALEQAVQAGIARISRTRSDREDRFGRTPRGPQPWLYVIVATGNIYEDVVQARSAARQGADIIAVIRSTAQSLLDYVPYGPTTEGFGGTFATQENFRIMRRALDEVGDEVGRYIQLVNYASGLCMPEISVMGAFERLDMMLNDAMYGILFRDINIRRTLIDQQFSRMINAAAGIIINTGEDNYLTTADAVEEAHTVLASQFINKEFANRAGMPDSLIGLGHAFEIDPLIENGFLMELAQAQLVRQLFAGCPIKYMPPTKHMTGNIFRGHLQDGLFNLAGIMTGQSIQLLGMMTEAIHTPFMQDRALSIENAKYVMNNVRDLGDEITFSPNGRIQQRADLVLSRAAEMLEEIAGNGLVAALEQGRFAGVKRPESGGKGAAGVAPVTESYRNPFKSILEERLGIDAD